ncbi:MAG TPA: mannose-1-phosphate guanylyltransferase/mannose-6-phosphate isomerase [Micavibrio sp.]|jgi:mannose-1-phosphate guanylyltransferase/mannose-6-phosphate isomerase
MKSSVIVPVILCGGSGTRLWPASRENYPKQFLSLMDDFSLLQNTVKRALRTTDARIGNIVTVTLGALGEQVKKQLSEIDPAAARHILCEPSARNTAAAVALAAAYIKEHFGDDTIMWVLPADHHIGDENNLARSFAHALKAAQDGYLVTFGIRPTRPDTGYGYILLGENFAEGSVSKAQKFVEKPDRATAQAYLDAGNYLWNSGMFLFATDTVLNQYDAHASHILTDVRKSMASSAVAGSPDADLYSVIAKEPFDVAIMEKSAHVAIVPCDPEWSDIGSWESLWEIREKDMHENVVEGRAACYDTKRCLVQAKERLIACAGLEDIVIVDTGDAILIADRKNSDAMRVLVSGLKKSGVRELVDAPADAQAWSMTKILTEPSGYNAREITVNPGETLSLERHDHQSKFWTVVEGKASVEIGVSKKILQAYDTIYIPAGVDYSISGLSQENVKIVEVSQGAQGSIEIAASGARKEAA